MTDEEKLEKEIYFIQVGRKNLKKSWEYDDFREYFLSKLELDSLKEMLKKKEHNDIKIIITVKIDAGTASSAYGEIVYTPRGYKASKVGGIEYIKTIQSTIPELPDTQKTRYIQENGLSLKDISILIKDRKLADFFEDVIVKHKNYKLVATWITNEFLGRLTKFKYSIGTSPITVDKFSELISLIENGDISTRSAKDVFDEMFETGKTANEIVKEKDLIQISNEDQLEKIIDDLIVNSPKQVEQVKSQPKVMGWFVGQIMKATKGQGDPKIINEILRKKL